MQHALIDRPISSWLKGLCPGFSWVHCVALKSPGAKRRNHKRCPWHRWRQQGNHWGFPELVSCIRASLPRDRLYSGNHAESTALSTRLSSARLRDGANSKNPSKRQLSGSVQCKLGVHLSFFRKAAGKKIKNKRYGIHGPEAS